MLTRRDIVETALTAVGRRGRVFSVPPGVMRLSARFYGRSNARKAELFHFAAAVTTTDCVAPLVGARRLDSYFLARRLDRHAAAPASAETAGQRDRFACEAPGSSG